MQRLIVITHEFMPFYGGVAVYSKEVTLALHRIGFQVELWAPDYGRDNLKDNFPFPVVRLKCGGSLRWFHQLQLAVKIFQRRHDLGHATLLLPSVGTQMIFMVFHTLRILNPRRVYCVLHGSEILRFQRCFYWRMLAKNFFQHTKAIIGASHHVKVLVGKSFLKQLATKIVIAPCACSSDAMTPSSQNKALNHDKLRILTLARIHPRKGHIDTAQALASLPPNLRRQIIYQVGGMGNANYLNHIEKICREAGVAFQYLGEIHRENLASTYEQCDIYVLTSRTLPTSIEGFGITYLEASFHGKPIIAYKTGGVSEAVVQNQSGILVKEGDIVTLTDTLKLLISDSYLRNRLGEYGRQYAQTFSWEKSAGILADLWRRR